MYPPYFLARAIQQDRQDLVKYIFDLYGSRYQNELYETALREYAIKGDVDAVNNYLKLLPNYQIAVEGAIEGKREWLFEHISSMASPDYNWNFWGLLLKSMRLGDIKLVHDVIDLAGPNYQWNYDHIISLAAESGHTDIFQYIYSLAPENYNLNYDTLASDAVRSGQRNLFDYIRSLAPPDYNWNYQRLAHSAISSGNKELFNYIRSLAPRHYNWNWNLLADYAIFLNDNDFFYYIWSLVSSLAPNYKWDLRKLFQQLNTE